MQQLILEHMQNLKKQYDDHTWETYKEVEEQTNKVYKQLAIEDWIKFNKSLKDWLHLKQIKKCTSKC